MRPNQEVLDWAYLDDLTGGDKAFQAQLFEAYLDTAPKLLDDARAGVRDVDRDKTAHAAHTLKGSSRSIGATSVGLGAESVEHAVRQGDWHAAGAALAALEGPFGELVQLLRGLTATS